VAEDARMSAAHGGFPPKNRLDFSRPLPIT
jgi:hypothetical protein